MDRNEHEHAMSDRADSATDPADVNEAWPTEYRDAIREDLKEEEALRKEILELEREAEELEEARARRLALFGGESSSPGDGPS
jgi:hypothetical protein